MDHQTRLFQMLNAATSPPPSKSAAAASSPREAQPTPPPPTLQSVSLNDLFKGIQLQASSPSVSANGSAAGAGLEKALNASVAGPTVGLSHVGQHTPGTRSASQASMGSVPVSSPPPASGTTQDQRAKLLGMLSFGGSGAGTPVNVSTSGVPTPLPGHVQPESQASAPFGEIKSPVIDHSNPPQPAIAPVQDPAIASPPMESTDARTPEPSQPQSQAGQPRPKSAVPNFSFVSPFDAFDEPTPVTASPAKEEENPEPEVVKQEEKMQVPAPAPKEVKSKKSKIKSPVPPKAPELPVVTQDMGVKEESVANNTHQDQQGRGPKTTQSHITIDLSKPNFDSLVSTPDLLYIQPTTLLKVDVGYKKGRKVGLTRQFVAYTMSKGKIRLIDSRSGARLMLQTTTSTPGPIIDIAVCPVYVAALAADRSLWIWRVPAGWREDNPPVDLTLVSYTADGAIGKAFKVGWVKKNGADWVIVAGDEGVAMFDPTREGRGVKKTEETFAGKTIFRTMGNVVDFCVNNTQSAMGILSSNSTFSLYSTQSLNRVWQRSIPSSSPHSPPSSANFVESNVLIGRDQNTRFDLVQITVSLAVLSSIHFIAPPGLDPSSHYAHAMYDPFSGLLFITPFARSSLYVFRYALKDTEPVRDAGGPNGPQVVAFDRMAEFPLTQQGSSGTGVVTIGMIAHLGRDPGPGREEGDLEWFYGTADGFASAGMGKQAMGLVKGDVFASTITSPVADASVDPKKEKEMQPEKKEKKKSAQSTPTSKTLPLPQNLPVPQPVPSIGSRTDSTAGSLVEDADGAAVAAAASTGMNSKKLKKEKRKEERALARAQAAAEAEATTEAAWGAETLSAVPEIKSEREVAIGEEAIKQADRLSTQFQNLLTASISPLSAQLNTIASPSFSNNIAAQVERSLRPHIMSSISSELQNTLKGLMPQLINEMKNEVQKEVKSCLDNVPKDLEKGLGPVVSRTVAGVVQTSVEKMVQQVIHSHLLPTLTQSTSSLTDTLLTELKSEMLQIRKELTPIPPPVAPEAKRGVAEDEVLNKLQEMSQQMEALQTVVKDIQGKNFNGINHAQSVPNLPTTQGSPPPIQNTRLPTPAQLEDTFLAALTAQTVPATLQLVDDHLGLTDYCLPVSGKSPLSQAVLLTLLHRTSIAIAEIPAQHPLFPHLVTWIRRTVNLLDPSDPNIKEYIVRLHPVVQTHLSNVIASVQASRNPHLQAQFLPVLKEIGDVLSAKVNA
ncbi:hypothetical protein I352_01630 [Cryptococcus deuterogattii MMRL2647]|nr:hypothetical protein I352_01630 [Cryptococcus deuterogattii MMRL2647]